VSDMSTVGYIIYSYEVNSDKGSGRRRTLWSWTVKGRSPESATSGLQGNPSSYLQKYYSKNFDTRKHGDSTVKSFKA